MNESYESVTSYLRQIDNPTTVTEREYIESVFDELLIGAERYTCQ